MSLLTAIGCASNDATNPCNAGDHRVSEAGTGLCVCDAGFCDIGNICIADGTVNPDHDCSVCDSTATKDDWSVRGTEYECRASTGECDGAEVCDGVSPDCPADGFALNGTICDDSNDCTAGDSCLNGICEGTPYVCENSGTCNSDDNACTCETGFAGDYCDECALGYAGYPDCDQNTTPGFVPIYAGTFWMGAPRSSSCPEGYPGICEEERGNGDYERLHEVTLTYDFEMSRYEITEAEFRGLMGWNPMEAYDPNCMYGCGGDHPAGYLSWYDVLAYANQLSWDAGLTACYVFSDVGCKNGETFGPDSSDYVGFDYMECFDGVAPYGGIADATVTLAGGVAKPQDCQGYRLPTEAEWEYAIRAGSNTALYSGGITYVYDVPVDPNLDLIGWYAGNSGSPGTAEYGSKPVGGKEANAWGLYDMSGNVYEWAWDWFQIHYQRDVATDPVGPEDPGTFRNRIVRGGDWDRDARSCRSANRGQMEPGMRWYNIGARLCRTLH